MESIISKLNADEKRQFDEALAAFMKNTPFRLLMQVPMAADRTADIRVSSWPQSVRDIDTIIAALRAVRSAFLKQPTKAKR